MNRPQLRFPEFEGEWEKKKLGEVLIEPKQIAEVKPNEIELITVKLHCKGIENTGNFPSITRNGRPYYKRYKNEILIGRQNFHNGGVGIVKEEHNGKICSNAISSYNVKDDNLYFVYYFISRPEYYTRIDDLLGGTGQKEISKSEFQKLEISIPTLPEQTKIASFLTAVDEKIQALKKKHSLLAQYKKGVMQKLFSQELRFKDENGEDFPAWEKKKLGEVAEIIGGGTPETGKEEYWNGGINWFTPTEIKSNYVLKSIRTISKLGLQKSSAKLLPAGTILLTTRATIGDAAIALEECTTNQGFQSLIAKENYDNIFIFNWIKENKHELISRANGSTFSEISKTEIEKIEISFPTLPEQTAISNFLTALDEKINAIQDDVEKTETWKKGLLQKMFV